MNASAPVTTSVDFDDIRVRVTSFLDAFLAGKSREALSHGLAAEIPTVIRGFIDAGGKRFRPLLCVLGWQAAGGHGVPDVVLQSAAAIEMYQTFALIHDDVIDNSGVRRSQPTVHRALTDRHSGAHDAPHLGMSAAILIGDMALTWSDELFTTAAVPPEHRVALHRVIDTMREEMQYGQYLDLLAPLRPLTDQRTAMTVVRYKTAKYSVERPLHIGTVLAGAGPDLRRSLSRFALPIGDAFQLRDDMLGVFGDPAVTGKPVLDDLREGKHTVLLAVAAHRADAGQLSVLERLVGNPSLDEDGMAEILQVLDATDAPAAVEDMISARYAQALAALENVPLSPMSVAALRRFASLAVERTS